MSQNDSNAYVLVKDADGEKYSRLALDGFLR